MMVASAVWVVGNHGSSSMTDTTSKVRRCPEKHYQHELEFAHSHGRGESSTRVVVTGRDFFEITQCIMVSLYAMPRPCCGQETALPSLRIELMLKTINLVMSDPHPIQFQPQHLHIQDQDPSEHQHPVPPSPTSQKPSAATCT
jgi:hypothetical protein